MENDYPNILILMDLDRTYERGLVTGILQYSRLHGPFNFLRSERAVLGELHHLTLKKIKQWKPAGVIWREGHEIRNVESLDVPTIFFPTTRPNPELCNVVTDDRGIAGKVAKHLMARGLEHFAFCGLDDDHYWSRARKRAFIDAVEREGYRVDVFDLLESDESLAQWISKIPLPTGLMVCTDDCSLECYKAIREAGLKIPEDIAIVGVGNDELVCDFSNPPLSSVQLNLEEAGFRAAQRLAEMMKGNGSREDIVVDAFDVIERQSSNFLAIKDELVAEALRFIHDHRTEPIDVEDVVRAVPTSRRVLYRRFKKHLGRTIAKEIRIVRMNQAARMLIDSNFTIGQICEELGFDAPQNFSRAFLREKGMAPFKYRTKHSVFR